MEFMTRETIDNYLYIVHLKHNEKVLYAIGKKAYERFLEEDGLYIETKTKVLFPTYQIILTK